MPETPKRIHLLGNAVRFEEASAATTITPGMLVALTSAGKFTPHASAGGAAEAQFALEDALQGRTIADNYVADELVFTAQCGKGDVVYAILDVGENIAQGDLLASAGNGRLQAVGAGVAIAVALEAVDLSDSDAVSSHIRARIL